MTATIATITIATNMKTYIITTMSWPGSWGKGTNLTQAAFNCYKAGAYKNDMVAISIVTDDPDAYIDGFGMVQLGGKGKESAKLIHVGYAKLSGIMLKQFLGRQENA